MGGGGRGRNNQLPYATVLHRKSKRICLGNKVRLSLLLTSLLTYLHAYLLAYILTYLLTCSLTYFLTYLFELFSDSQDWIGAYM